MLIAFGHFSVRRERHVLRSVFALKQARRKIFLSYPSEVREIAEQIAYALKNDGHIVFFDKAVLNPGSDFNDRIRSQIEKSDLFVFLLSKEALAAGRFTLTELALARDRWPAAKGNVIPVLLDPTLSLQAVPSYLRSVHMLHVEGNAPAEVAVAVQKLGSKTHLAALGAAGIAFVAGLFVAFGGFFMSSEERIEILRPDQIDFRPVKPPSNTDSNWLDSEVALTVVPVQYSNKTNMVVRIHDERTKFRVDERTYSFKRFNEVEFKPTPCPDDWLCTKKPAGAENLEPGRTLSRQVMFIPSGTKRLNWQDLLKIVVAGTASKADVLLEAETESSEWGRATTTVKEVVCTIDLARLKGQIESAGYRSAALPPARLSPFCAEATSHFTCNILGKQMKLSLFIPAAALGVAINAPLAFADCPPSGPGDVCTIAQSSEIARPCEIYSSEGQCVKYAKSIEASIGIGVGGASPNAPEQQAPKSWWDRLFGN